jgi:hypothetical protein
MGDEGNPVTVLWLREKHFSLPRIESQLSTPSAVTQTDQLTAKYIGEAWEIKLLVMILR